MQQESNNRPRELNTLSHNRATKDHERISELKDNTPSIPTRLKPLVDFYKPSLFSGKIGKFKNIKVSLHIDPKVPPVAQPERRIPFALRKKV